MGMGMVVVGVMMMMMVVGAMVMRMVKGGWFDWYYYY